MDDAFLASLRCPFDPARNATLSREGQSLTCSGCQTTFPVKNSIPILTPDEAHLPTGVKAPGQLPCIQHARRERRN